MVSFHYCCAVLAILFESDTCDRSCCSWAFLAKAVLFAPCAFIHAMFPQVDVQGPDEAFLGSAVRGRYLQINILPLDAPDLAYTVACARKITLRLLFEEDAVKVVKHSEVVASAPTCAVNDMTLPMTPFSTVRPNHCYNLVGYLESGGFVGKDHSSWAGRLVTSTDTLEVYLPPTTVTSCNDAGKGLPRPVNVVVFAGIRCDAAYYQEKFFLRLRAITGTDWYDADLDSLLSADLLTASLLYRHATASKPRRPARPPRPRGVLRPRRAEPLLPRPRPQPRPRTAGSRPPRGPPPAAPVLSAGVATAAGTPGPPSSRLAS